MIRHNLQDESELPSFFVTAQTLNYKNRIDMQSVWQEHIDASISSTVNLPNSTTIEEVEELYLYAWEQYLKGITIYRDGCKRSGILTTNDTKKEETTSTEVQTAPSNELPRGFVIHADDDVVGKKRKLMTGCGSLHCSAFFDPVTGQLMETYFSKGSTGGCGNFMVGLSRMISLAARAGCSIEDIVDQLYSCGSCPSYAVRSATKRDTSKGSCCPMAIGNALKDMYDEMMSEITCEEDDEYIEVEVDLGDDVVVITKPVNNPCPQCGDELHFEGGCNICKSCGWSKCD
jgi:ribonucleoside-diphosphate reductase alpha chain